ncbi:MAG: O-antigen ligase family protein [Verrucomicrobiota bacterium]
MRTSNTRAILLGVLISLPAWLGGDLTTWRLGVYALALAAYGLFFPPGFELSRSLKWALGLVVAWPLVGFIPRVVSTKWHGQLTELGMDLSWSWTPQPWILLDAWLVMLIVAFCFLCLFASKLDLHETHITLRAFGVSVVGVAVVALASSWNQVDLPGWDPLYGIGPFPNRNQTGNLFALSGVMLMALASHESRNNRSQFLVWAGGSGILFLATIMNGSRTGVVLYLAGVLIWAVLHLAHARDKRKAIILVGVSGLCLAAFLFIGGEALQRLTATASELHVGEGLLSGRWEIWQDSARLFSSSPLHGVGIGNYSELFALYREKLVAENRVIHPDSDYVWWITEIGLLGMALIGWAVILVLAPYFKGSRRSGRRLRTAAAVASILFLVHALVDVSAHRIGTLIPALLWARLSWPAFKSDDFQLPVTGKNALVAVILIFCIGIWFVLPRFTSVMLPNSTTVEKVKADWQQEYQSAPDRALKRMRYAAGVAPLDWQVQYCIGLGTLLHERSPEKAWQHWTIARTLEPMMADLPYHEGQVWIHSDIARTWYVWREALQRRNLNRSGLLRDMLEEAKDVPELKETLLFLASRMPELRHYVLSQLTPKEFEEERDAYLAELSPENLEQRIVIQHVWREWARRDGVDEVADYLRSHPEWMVTGWKYIVDAYRQQQQFRQAYQFMKGLFPQPDYPEINTSAEARRAHLGRVLQGSADLVAVYSFLRYDRDSLSLDKGKAAIRMIAQDPQMPAYMRYLIAEYLAENDEWNEAVGYLQHYGTSLNTF